jgi:hypothetical protein
MSESLQGRFREAIHNNYTCHYFVYIYTQICDKNELIWGLHGLGIFIRIISFAIALEKIIEYKCPIHGYMSTNLRVP